MLNTRERNRHYEYNFNPSMDYLSMDYLSTPKLPTFVPLKLGNG